MYKPLFPRSGCSNRNPVDQKVSGGKDRWNWNEKEGGCGRGMQGAPSGVGDGGEGWGHCEEALASLA